MILPHFDIPEIPWELLEKGKCRMRKVWALEDLNLKEPAMRISWAQLKDALHSKSSMGGLYNAPVSRMMEDPETDVRAQLESVRHVIAFMEAGQEIGLPVTNFPTMHMIHFGIGPLATAFGAKLVIRGDEQPFFEPAVHTPEEVMRLRKPDLHRDGMCPMILERIDYYNEATRGKIPICACDTSLPWSMATQIWHYEDMLEAIYTAPEAVHYLLNLVTECIIEWIFIQESRIGRWCGSHRTLPWPWHPRGCYFGDDTMVTKSPAAFEELHLPYNNRVSHELGGIIYHCCMKYDTYFPALLKTEGFMGMDPQPGHNDIGKIEETLSGRGVWVKELNEKHIDLIRRFRGKIGLFLSASGDTRRIAIDSAKRLLDIL